MTQGWGAIGERLRQPQSALTLTQFAAVIQARSLVLHLPGLAPAAQDQGLPGRIRGAFGQVLAEAASPDALAGQPCPWDPPCAFEALFRKQGRMTPGIDFPSPWVLAVDTMGDALAVTLTVFGMATEWMPAAAEALTAAVSHRVDWSAGGKAGLRGAAIAGRRLLCLDGLSLEEGPPSALEVRLLSPLVSSGEGADADPMAAFITAGHRLEGLARWHEATLGGETWPALAEAFRRLDATWRRCNVVSWPRGSRRQQRSIPMRGIRGQLTITGTRADLERVWPVLVLGTVTHIGADIAFGCGRYELAPSSSLPNIGLVA